MECTLDKKLGHGTFGDVWKGTCNGRQYAIKVYKPHKNAKSEFLHEKMILEKLSDSCQPYALCYKGSYEKDGVLHLVTNLIVGNSFHQLLFHYPVDVRKEKYTIVLDLINGIHGVHKSGIVHQDLKGSNIMADNTTRIFHLIDFGFASDGSTCFENGTPYTQVEELTCDSPWDQAVANDLWGIGCLLLRWFTFTDGQQVYSFPISAIDGYLTNAENVQYVIEQKGDVNYPKYSEFTEEYLDQFIRLIDSPFVRVVVALLLVKGYEQRNINFRFVMNMVLHIENIKRTTHDDLSNITDGMITKLISQTTSSEIPTLARMIEILQ